MALQVSMEVKGMLYQNAYLKIGSVNVDNVRKVAVARVFVYASQEARQKGVENYIDVMEVVIGNGLIPNPNYQPPQYDEQGNLIQDAVGEPYLNETYFQKYIDGSMSVLQGVYQYLKDTRFPNAVDV